MSFQSRKHRVASPEARAAMHEMMAAFQAFKDETEKRLAEIERKASQPRSEENT